MLIMKLITRLSYKSIKNFDIMLHENGKMLDKVLKFETFLSKMDLMLQFMSGFGLVG